MFWLEKLIIYVMIVLTLICAATILVRAQMTIKWTRVKHSVWAPEAQKRVNVMRTVMKILFLYLWCPTPTFDITEVSYEQNRNRIKLG